MVSLTLMARLLEALAPATRLVLVGDPDQLASVEAGAVLGDLVDQDDVGPVGTDFGASLRAVTDGVSDVVRLDSPGAALRESVALLHTVHRFTAGGSIAQLAQQVRAGHADDALAMLRSGAEGLVFHETPDDAPIDGSALMALQHQAGHERAVIDAARAGDAGRRWPPLDRHRLLCAHRGGPRGVRIWSDAVERWLAADDRSRAPPRRPVRRPAAAGDRQRLRERALQRRHRSGPATGRRTGRRRSGVAARRCCCRWCGCPTCDPCTP